MGPVAAYVHVVAKFSVSVCSYIQARCDTGGSISHSEPSFLQHTCGGYDPIIPVLLLSYFLQEII